MNRTRFIAIFICVLGCCAFAPHARAQDVSANPDGRMTRLAKQLAQTPDQSAADGQSPDTPQTTADQSSSAKVTGTPLIAPGSDVPETHTPLLKPGRSLDSKDTERTTGSAWLLKTITALGVVIALALTVRYVYGRMGGKVASYASPVVEVLSRTTVAPRSHVMLLRVGGRVLIVSESSAGMRTLASIDDAQEVADILGAVNAAKPSSISKSFGRLMHKFSDEHEADPEATAILENEPNARVHQSVSGLLSRVRSMGREGGAV